MNKNKNVLLTNDDGFNSEEIKILYATLKKFFDVVIVAPDSEKSGVGHSFTFKNPLFYKKIINDFAEELYCVNGSPADCVKFAVSYLLPYKPDIIVSGLNKGENSGISSYYSGTVAAAREGCFWGIKSFAFSLCEEAIEYSISYINMIPVIINELINFNRFFENKGFFNINFPSCKPELINGIKVTKQSCAFFKDTYCKVKSEKVNMEEDGYVIKGNKIGIENDVMFDSRALIDNWITVTPLSCDATAHNEITELREIENRFSLRGL